MDLLTADTNVMEKHWTNKIQTLAVGGPTYADIRMGSQILSEDEVSEFLRLRVYKVEYRTNIYERKISPTLHCVAKGNLAYAHRYCSNIDILKNYWLG